ncbi:MAG: COX15/CtaA family protein [Acidilobaceae archaeon]
MRLTLTFTLTATLAFLTVSLGSLTRALGAGLACGVDWPFCLGSIIPPMILYDIEVALEYTHRITAFMTFLLALTTLYIAMRDSNIASRIKYIALTMVLIITLQVLIGMLVVKLHIEPLISAIHNIMAILIIVIATIEAVISYYNSL